MPATVELALAAMLLAILVAIPLGIVAAVWAGTAIDHTATTMALSASRCRISGSARCWRLCFPSCSVGFRFLAGERRESGAAGDDAGAPLAAVLARMTRASVIEELRELYVVAARARGVSRAPS